MALCYQPNIVIQGLKLAYDAANPKCYAGVGTFVNDLSGNNNTGYLYSGASYSSNLTGYFSFDGSDDYIGTNFQPNYDFITVNVWFWSGAFSTFGTNTCIVANSQVSSPYPSFDIRKRITGALQLQFAISSSGSEIGQDIGFINDYTWYNVQFTYDGATVKCWLNGIQVVNYTIAGTLRNSTSNLFIAKNPAFAGRNAAIYVSQLFIYNRALSEAEIQRNYNATKQKYIYTEDIVFDGLIANYDPVSLLSYSGTGNTLADLSGNNNHAVLFNGAAYSGSGVTGHIALDGTNDFISSIDVSAYNDLTIEFWIFDARGAFQRDYLTYNDDAGSYTVFNTTYFRTDGNGAGARQVPSAVVFTNQWFRVCYIKNSDLWVNGTQYFGTGTDRPYGRLKFGNSRSNVNSLLNGRFGPIKIYNRNLTPAEIKQNFEAIRGRYGI
jgi:hypothetical protein